MAFGFVSALRFARLARGKSLDQAALAAGVSASVLSRGERGLIRLGPDVVTRLEQYYGCPGLLMARPEPREAPVS